MTIFKMVGGKPVPTLVVPRRDIEWIVRILERVDPNSVYVVGIA